ITGYDGQTMYEVTRSLVERGAFAVSPEFNTLPGPDGRDYSRYGLGLSLVAAIPYAAARPFAFASSHANEVLEAAVSCTMAFVVAALVVALYLLARRIDARAGAALLVAAGGVAGTYMLPYSKEFFSEPLAALCLVMAMERILGRHAGAAGFALGAAVLVRPQSLLFAPVLLTVAWWQQGLGSSIRAAAAAAPGILAAVAYNVVRFGRPLSFGYEDVGFTTPLLNGLGGLLFEPTKSVLLFAPICLLLPFALWSLWQCNRPALVLIAGNFGITLGVVAMWFAWHGGWCWGPRLLLPGLAPTIASVGPWLVRPNRWRATALLFTLGFLVSLPAMLVPTQAQQLERPRIPQQVLREGHFMRTQPLASPYAWRQLQLLVPTVRYSIEHRYKGLDDGRNYLRYLSLWQVGATRKLQRAGLLVSLMGTLLLFLLVVFTGHKVRAGLVDIRRLDRPSPGSPD
ncbi:MAG TPA: hypothetical protein VMS54_02965, partial [Vicinamibacterales bacterium]|nr:hypothetical protein [Vicinamibacterales bacterium]